jgi:hypothetical protein
LQAGKRYYIEALHKENSGGDNLAVGWQVPASATIEVIPGSRLSPFVVPNARISAEDVEGNTLSLQLYPNPSQGDRIGLALENVMPETEVLITLYNAVGQAITKTVSKANNSSFTKELVFGQRLTPGVYTVVIQAGDQYVSKKLIIVK